VSRVKFLPTFSPQNASYRSAGRFLAFLIICVASIEAGPTLAIFRLACDHRGEAPNRRNAHNNGACGYDSCAHVGAPFKTKMSASVRFHSCLPVTERFRMKSELVIADIELCPHSSRPSEGSEAGAGYRR
jgi:hypothetical protein